MSLAGAGVQSKMSHCRLLKNLGNSCYLNAILQALVHLEHTKRAFIAGVIPGSLLERVMHFLRFYESGTDVFAPVGMLSAILEFKGTDGRLKFRPNDHEDACELLHFLTESLAFSCSRTFRWACECDGQAETQNNSPCIALGPTVGQSLLDRIISSDKPEDKNCEGCAKPKKCETIVYSTDVLFVTLQHDQGVECVPELQIELDGRTLDLQSIVQHKGTQHSGHYRALILKGDEFVCCDDSSPLRLMGKDEIVGATHDGDWYHSILVYSAAVDADSVRTKWNEDWTKVPLMTWLVCPPSKIEEFEILLPEGRCVRRISGDEFRAAVVKSGGRELIRLCGENSMTGNLYITSRDPLKVGVLVICLISSD